MCICNAAFSDKSIIGLGLEPDKSFREYPTEAIYRRSAISDEKALKEAGAK